MEKKRLWFIISLLLLVPGLVSLSLWQLPLGRDFKGGSLSEYRLEAGDGGPAETVEQRSARIKAVYSEQGISEVQIQTDTQPDSSRRFYVKSASITQEKHADIVRRLSSEQPKLEELSFETIDPQVGSEVTRRAIMAVIVASLAIIIYIALSFRGVPKPASSLQFGVIAVITLLHDVLFIIGFYSLMGHYFHWEVNAEFVTAALTVMGFSVHDTIVVFDRIRENLRSHAGHTFRAVANISLAQTVARSLNTSLTVVLVLLAVVLLGGDTIRPFALTMLVGIAAGTYSSIFVATPLLDWWQTITRHYRFTFEWKKPHFHFKRAA